MILIISTDYKVISDILVSHWLSIGISVVYLPPLEMVRKDRSLIVAQTGQGINFLIIIRDLKVLEQSLTNSLDLIVLIGVFYYFFILRYKWRGL